MLPTPILKAPFRFLLRLAGCGIKVVVCWGLLAGCSPSAVQETSATPPPGQEPHDPAMVFASTVSAPTPTTGAPRVLQTPFAAPVPLRTPAATAAQTLSPTASPGPRRAGPDAFAAGLNPLSGLPVASPENLSFPPVLVSISNYPKAARPQAGLSYSPLVFEMYIGAGVSRFLAVFYGDYPPQDAAVGPIRSGRIPYESLRQLYRGHLVFASASKWVYPYLDEYTVVYGQDDTSLISARLPVTELREIAEASLEDVGRPGLTGLLFDPAPPQGGRPARSLWMAYHYTDQIFWRYDPQLQGFMRFQETDQVSQFASFTDSLTQELLLFENVVVMFADYHFYTDSFFDIDLQYISRLPALVFRDGQMYEVYWTTGNQAYEKKTGKFRPVRFVDAQGEPFPLKNGQTWVVIVPRHTPYHETLDSENYFDLRTRVEPGSAMWAVQFYAPEILDQPPE